MTLKSSDMDTSPGRHNQHTVAADASSHKPSEGLSGTAQRSLRVSQVFSACSFCKSRKIKCDGVAPACGGCTRFGRRASCSISSSTSLQGRDYPTHLQDRIRQLRSQLRRLQADDGLAGINPATDHHTQPPSDHSNEANVIDSLIADIGALPIIASSYPSSYDGPTLSTVVLGAASKTTLAALESPSFNRLTFLPNRETSMKLARHYIDKVYPRLPFFSVQGFWVQFQHVFSSEVSHRSGNISPPQNPSSVLSPSREDVNSSELNQCYSYFTVLLVLAISASSLSRSADSIISNQAQRLFNSALRFRESAVLPNTIIGVQSLLFLIQYAILNPSILSAWYLIGVAMRNCIDLGLHQDPEPAGSVAPSLLETRRRLWWSVYSVDRSMSLALFRPTEISDKVINASLPSFRIESSATEVEIEGYLQRYRALQLQSRIYELLSCTADTHAQAESTVSDLLLKLSEWKNSNSPSHDQILVETEWLMGKMLLYRPCPLLPIRTVPELRDLWGSSLSFVSLYRSLVESNSIFYIQIASEKVYWAGLAILYSYCHVSHSLITASTAPGSEWQPRPVELWMAVKDIMFVLRALSERWEDGKLLASDFERTSALVIELDGSEQSPSAMHSKLPREVSCFGNYASLTSIRLAEEKARPLESTDKLQDLVSELFSHS